MTDRIERETLYAFKPEEVALMTSLSKAVPALLLRPSLSPRDVHLSAVLLRVLERLPLVSDGVGLTLTLTARSSGENYNYMDMTVDEESFRSPIKHARAVEPPEKPHQLRNGRNRSSTPEC